MPPRPRLPVTLRKTVFDLNTKGFSSNQISDFLCVNHHVSFSARGVRFLLNRRPTQATVISERKPRSRTAGRKIFDIHEAFINMWMEENTELTSRQIQDRLEVEFNVCVSRKCVSYYRQKHGWNGKTQKYCQLISNMNVGKRFDYAVRMLATREKFENVIFTDETTVEMSSNGRVRFYRTNNGIDRLPSKAPKPKHAYKVHMWAGISYRGRTNCCVFTGLMDSVIYQQILRDNLLPFVREVFPNGYRFYQDNDSKHKSKSTVKWMEENDMKHRLIETPASSPDLNPIENVWATMKDFLQRHVKPKKKEELVNGIKLWWESLTPEQCGKYIDHVHKVLPAVVLNHGGPTDY